MWRETTSRHARVGTLKVHRILQHIRPNFLHPNNKHGTCCECHCTPQPPCPFNSATETTSLMSLPLQGPQQKHESYLFAETALFFARSCFRLVDSDTCLSILVQNPPRHVSAEKVAIPRHSFSPFLGNTMQGLGRHGHSNDLPLNGRDERWFPS